MSLLVRIKLFKLINSDIFVQIAVSISQPNSVIAIKLSFPENLVINLISHFIREN